MLLQTFGGVYADIDAECVAPLDGLVAEERVVLCEEPPTHWPLHMHHRGHPLVLFNGVMASPAGHPFWNEVVPRLAETRFAYDTLDRTGPCFLTGIYLSYADKASIRLEECHLFTPTDKEGNVPPRRSATPAVTYARHEWAGTWFSDATRTRRFDIKGSLRRLYAEVTRGPVLDARSAQAAIDRNVLARPRAEGKRLAVLVPVRDAADDLRPFIEALAKIDIDPATTRLVFCEGDSVDDTWARLNAMAPELRERFRDVVLTQKSVGTHFRRNQRWLRPYQRARRVGLAAVRNHLIDVGVTDDIDWALWIDVDVWGFPPDIVARLKGTGARIAVPHCVKVPNGPTFDRNTFIETWDYPPRYYYKHMRDGLFMPPMQARGRLHPDSLRHSERVEVDGVGGTVLLVDANVHRAGVRFPERPYRDHIETEGFGLLARDVGVRAVLLPRVEVFHNPW